MAGLDGVRVLNEVDHTQVGLGFDEPDRAAAVADRLVVDGRTWMSGSRWHGEDVLRISVSNWATDADDVEQAVDAVRLALAHGASAD